MQRGSRKRQASQKCEYSRNVHRFWKVKHAKCEEEEEEEDEEEEEEAKSGPEARF